MTSMPNHAIDSATPTWRVAARLLLESLLVLALLLAAGWIGGEVLP